MRDADRAVGRIDRLSARARRAVDVDPQVIVVDLDVDFLGLGQDGDGCGRGMDASAAFRHRHALDAVHAALELQPREHALSRHRGDDFLVTAHIGHRGGDQFDLPAAFLGITRIHAKQIAREQRGFIAASPGPDFEHRRALVRRILGEQREGEGAFGSWKGLADRIGFFLRHVAHFRIGEHLFQSGKLVAQPLQFARCRRDRLNLGIFLGKRDEPVCRQIARGKLRRQFLAPRQQCGDPFCGDGGHASAATSDVYSVQPSRPPGPRLIRARRANRVSEIWSSGTDCCPLSARFFRIASPSFNSSSPRMTA